MCHLLREAEDSGRGEKTGSIGVLAPNTLCKIVSTETGEEVGVGESGELCIAGPQVMKGYLGRPDETAHCMEGEFLHTGDIGYVDDSGNYFIVDRVKELIKFKGFQVPPAELESKLVSPQDPILETRTQSLHFRGLDMHRGGNLCAAQQFPCHVTHQRTPLTHPRDGEVGGWKDTFSGLSCARALHPHLGFPCCPLLELRDPL